MVAGAVGGLGKFARWCWENMPRIAGVVTILTCWGAWGLMGTIRSRGRAMYFVIDTEAVYRQQINHLYTAQWALDSGAAFHERKDEAFANEMLSNQAKILELLADRPKHRPFVPIPGLRSTYR